MSDGCLGCARLEDPACTTVVLLAGPTVCTWCPEWLAETRDRETEARWLLGLSDRQTRVRHLEAREREFGAEYRHRLEAAVLGLWERRRAAQAARSGDS